MPINNDRKAELWALFAAQALAGVNASNVRGEDMLIPKELTEEAAKQADAMMSKFHARFPEYTGD